MQTAKSRSREGEREREREESVLGCVVPKLFCCVHVSTPRVVLMSPRGRPNLSLPSPSCSSLHSPPPATALRGYIRAHCGDSTQGRSTSFLGGGWRLLCGVRRHMAFFRSYSNASSGMGVAAECKETFLELQRKKAHRYIIFKIDEKGKEVVVEKTGAATESFDDFTASLPETDCRYAVYDFDFVTEENCQKSKIFFVAWSPSVSRIRSKMLYATSKQRFRPALDGVHYEIQATDPSELAIEVLRDRAH